jgi:predicted nucleic acid-binding protein
VKLVVPEPGSEQALAAWDAAERIVSSLVLYPEARSALGRAARARRLTRRRLDDARGLVDLLWRDVDRIELTERLARRAGDIAERDGLRAYDAVHLASFEQLGDSDGLLVSVDGALLAAARARGFATVRASG